jgi:hypothetical protein
MMFIDLLLQATFYLGGLFFQKGDVVKGQGQQMMDGRMQFSR